MLAPSMSELYHTSGSTTGYDSFNQLQAFERGTLSANDTQVTTNTSTALIDSESWTGDPLGDDGSVTTNGTAQCAATTPRTS